MCLNNHEGRICRNPQGIAHSRPTPDCVWENSAMVMYDGLVRKHTSPGKKEVGNPENQTFVDDSQIFSNPFPGGLNLALGLWPTPDAWIQATRTSAGVDYRK